MSTVRSKIKAAGEPGELEVTPLAAPPDAVISVPGSKSVTNRAFILAALADGESTLTGALQSEDTVVMAQSLRALGTGVEIAGETVIVRGMGGGPTQAGADLFCANSGTSIRFLTALCGLGQGEFRLDGVPRMRQRPQGELLRALRQLGVDARSTGVDECPPLLVRGSGRAAGGRAELSAEASSQFLTALLMIAPYADTDVVLDILGALRPDYVSITLKMMEQWGVLAGSTGGRRFTVQAGQRYRAATEYAVEPDASSASYFFAAAAVTGGRVTVRGLNSAAMQGDVRFATEILVSMGCEVESTSSGLTVTGPPPGSLRGVDADMSGISDTSLTLAAIAPFANGPVVVRNIGHSRLQECDRIVAACEGLTALGVRVEERQDGYTVWPARALQPARVETFHDHRVAMSFAVTGLRTPGVTIMDPGCVAKTFPDFWERLKLLRA